MYQPKTKSFEFYIQLGYEFASGKKLNNDELKLLEKISDIDTSIIKIDDILDNEEYRNGKKCIHLIDGIEKTIINAKLDEINGIKGLVDLIEFKNVFPKFDYEILKKFNTEYMYGIYKGQEMDFQLEKSDYIDNNTLDIYLEMSELFTGGHIRYGLEIGQLLANKKINKDLSFIASKIGIIRQIVDDFEDYFKAHHNPFGDIKKGRKRLPEILFTLNNCNRDNILNYINNKEFDKVIKEVLSYTNRNSIYDIVNNYLKEINHINIDFNIEGILVDYKQVLNRKI